MRIRQIRDISEAPFGCQVAFERFRGEHFRIGIEGIGLETVARGVWYLYLTAGAATYKLTVGPTVYHVQRIPNETLRNQQNNEGAP